MKTKIKQFIYIIISVLLPVLFFSCSSPISPVEDGNSSIRLVIENSRNTTNTQQLNYEVTIKSSNIEKHVQAKEGEPLVIKDLPPSVYAVSVRSEDDDFIYEGVQEVKVEHNKTVNVNIKIEAKQKGGQISLYFRAIYLDKTTTFNCEILSNDKVIFEKKDIKATDIINGKYIIPNLLPDGNYKVNITGGHVSEEQYVVNKNETISVRRGQVQEVEVKALPYKTIYLSSVTSSSGTGGDGTQQNPIHSLQGAISLAKQYNEPIKIIVSGKIEVSTETIELTQGLNITFVGQDKVTNKETIKAKITDSLAKELFRINGANVSFVNIDLEVQDNTYPSITFNSGSLTLYDDVYVKEIKLNNNNKIKLRAPLVENKDYKISLDSFSEDKEIFDLSINSRFNSNNIILFDRQNKYNSDLKNFYVDNRGVLKRKLYDASFKLTKAQVDTVQYSEVYYTVKENNKEITPLTYVHLDYLNQDLNTFTVPHLKMGINYQIDVFSRRKRTDANEKDGGITYTYDNYDTYQYDMFSNLDSPITIDLSKGKRTTGSLQVVFDKQYKVLDYPLQVTLTSSNGDVIKKTLEGFGYYINYLSPDTYTVKVETDDPTIRYNVVNNTVVVGDIDSVNCTISEEKAPVYYVKTVEASTNEGTKENPFISLDEAITKVRDITEPITLIIESDLTIDTKILIETPMNITLVGKDIVNPSPDVANITPSISAYNGLFTISNSTSKVTLKNLNFEYQRDVAKEEESLIEIINGELNILQNVNVRAVVIDKPNAPISVIKVGSQGRIYTSGFILDNRNSYILLEDNAKLSLLNSFYLRDFIITLKAVNPVIDKQIVESATGDNSVIKESLISLSYLSSDAADYAIDENGKIVHSGYINVSGLEDYINKCKPGTLNTLRVYVRNKQELDFLGKKIRGITEGPNLDVFLKLGDSIKTIDSTSFNYDNKGLQNIKSLTIESPILESIGNDAFKNCDYLETITLPEGIRSIGNNAFDYCAKLVTINLPSSLEKIGDNAFRVQENQKENQKDTVFNFPPVSKIRSFGQNALQNRSLNRSSSGLDLQGTWKTTIVRGGENPQIGEVRETLAYILNESFSKEKRLGESIRLEKVMTMQEAVSLLNESKDSSIDINLFITASDDIANLSNALKGFSGNTVTLYLGTTDTTINSIPLNAFNGCSKLTSITIPDVVKEINKNAFSGCTSLSEVNVSRMENFIVLDNTPWKVYGQSDEAIINNRETPQGFANKVVGQYSGYEWKKALREDEINSLIGTPNADITLDILAYYESLPGGTTLSVNMQKYKGPINLDLSTSTFKMIESNYFGYISNLHSVILPDTLEVIGDTAFRECTNIKTITIPEKVYSIGSSIFDGCRGLTDIVFMDTSSKWEFYTASDDKYSVGTISEVPSKNKPIFDKIDYLNKFVKLNEAKTRIASYNEMFRYESVPYQLPLPVIVESKQELKELGRTINHDISPNYDNLPALTIRLSLILEGEGNNVIGNEFNDVTLDNPTKVPSGCDELFMVTIHTPGVTINSGAFMNSKNLFKVAFDPTSVVKGGAFTGCLKLEYVSNHTVSTSGFVMNGKEINSYTSFTLPEPVITLPSDQTIESIADYAFYGCKTLQEIKFSDDITKVGNYAFANCSELSKVSLSLNPAFNTLSTGLFYMSKLGFNDPAGGIATLTIPDNVTTIKPGALYTTYYKDLDTSTVSASFINFRNQSDWNNENNSKTFAVTSFADVIQRLVRDTVVGEDGIPKNDTYTNTASSSR